MAEKATDLLINAIWSVGLIVAIFAPMILIPRWLNKKTGKGEKEGRVPVLAVVGTRTQAAGDVLTGEDSNLSTDGDSSSDA